MSKHNVFELPGREIVSDPVMELLSAGAKQLIYQAIEAELTEFLSGFSDQRTESGHAAVVRNGYQPERPLQTAIGPVTVKIPKVRSRTGEPVTFRSALVPPYVRKTRSLEAAIPWLYLKGISSGEMGEALKVLVGAEAEGLSASTVSRLKQVWAKEYHEFDQSDLSKDRWVYVWADGVYSGLRAEQARLCALVIIGVNERGQKRLLAIEDGVRESTQSWREVLLKLKARKMNAPQLAVGDGAMGFWSALEEVYPSTGHQRCWMHKTMNILNCLPKTLQAKAKQSLHEIWQAPTKADAETAFDLFIKTYEDKYPKATQCLDKDHQELMSFYNYPATHWQSLRTTNPIESTFATIRHRTRRSRGCLTRDGMLHMMFKLGQCAEKNWRKLRGFRSLDKVIRGVPFKDGIEINKSDQIAA